VNHKLPKETSSRRKRKNIKKSNIIKRNLDLMTEEAKVIIVTVFIVGTYQFLNSMIDQ